MVPERTQARANPARGVALICTALVVGIFLLRNGFGDQGVPDVSADTTAVTQPSGGGDAAAPPEGGGTTAPPEQTPVKDPGDLTVRVANAAGVNGAAANWTDTITQAGYKTVEATNAQPSRDTTAVLYAAGFDREAVELARAIGAPLDGTVALTEPPQVDPGGANLVVLLGTDLANG
jgi:LytR cell envelope-related transcriptional attenuator